MAILYLINLLNPFSCLLPSSHPTEIRSTVFNEIMSGPEVGAHLHGLVLVDPRRASVSAPGAGDGLLLPRGHQGVLPGIPRHPHSLSQTLDRHQFRVGRRHDQERHRQRATQVLQKHPGLAGQAPADGF